MYYENMPLSASLYRTIILSFSLPPCIHCVKSCLELFDRVTRGGAAAVSANHGEFTAVGRRLGSEGWPLQAGSRVAEIG